MKERKEEKADGEGQECQQKGENEKRMSNLCYNYNTNKKITKNNEKKSTNSACKG